MTPIRSHIDGRRAIFLFEERPTVAAGGIPPVPRYTYVIAFPVLVALCIGINIQRYPTVSVMLQGEAVESRWLGRSEIFHFHKTETASYQGYQSDTDSTSIPRSSREPIPLSGSRSVSSSETDAVRSDYSARYGSSYDDGSYDSSSTRGSNSYGSDTSSHGSGSSYGTSGSGSSYGSSSQSGTGRYGGSDDDDYDDDYDDDSYGESSYGGGSYDSSSTRGSNSYGNGTSSYGSGSYYGSSSYGSSSQNGTGRYGGSDDDDYDDDSYGESSYGSSSEDANRYGAAESDAYHVDRPLPGYSSQFTVGEDNATASSPTTNATVTSVASSNADSAEVKTARTLSLQEKLELRLATPFSLTPSSSQKSDSDVYIPPDFLPSPEKDASGRLYEPSSEPVASITPVVFGTMDTSATRTATESPL